MSENLLHTDVEHALRLLRQGSTAEARLLLENSIVANPQNALIHHLLGVSCYYSGDKIAAVAAYQQAIKLKPDYTEAYCNLGIALNDLGQYMGAVRMYSQAIAIKPDYAEAYNNIGVTFNNLRRHTEAVAACQKAISIKPEYAEAYYNLGNVLGKLKHYTEAVEAYQQAISLNPSHVEAYYNLGIVLHSLNRLEEARMAYHQAVSLRPAYMAARWNSCLVLLSLGQFQLGWQDYEMRWVLPEKLTLLDKTYPCWLGEGVIEGKNLLIQFEQGFGDAIQMIRYVTLLEEYGAMCWIHVPSTLMRLFARSFPKARVTTEPCPKDIDYRIPVMSLPLALKTFSELSIPKSVPYLIPDQARVTFWRDSLSSPGQKIVGLVWRGKPTHSNDHNRSANLVDLLPLIAAHRSIRFITLQKDLTNDERVSLAEYSNVRVLDTELHDFDESAAVTETLDMMISVDSAPAHLAGALGKTTWILLPFCGDWRWLTDRSDSPWYPTARLFRQQSAGDWPGLVNSISIALAVLK